MEIFYFLIGIIGMVFMMLLFTAPVIAILNYFNKKKYGDKYENNTRDFLIIYSIVATFFLLFGYFNKGIAYVIIILIAVGILFLILKFKTSKLYLKQKLLIFKYKTYRKFIEPHPCSQIPDFRFEDYDVEKIVENRIKSISENKYKTIIKNGVIKKSDIVIESKNYYDKNGECIESFKKGKFVCEHHYIYKKNGKGSLIEFYSYTNDNKLKEVTHHTYNNFGKLSESITRDNNLKIISKEVFKYSEKGELIEEIKYDENLDISWKILNTYNKGNKTKTVEIINNEITKTFNFKYDFDSNLVEKSYNNESFGVCYFKNYTFNKKGKLIEKGKRSFKSDSISESLTNYNENGIKIKHYECDNDYMNNNISSKIETYLYDKNGNIREITNLQGYQTYSFYEIHKEEMKSIATGNILYDLNGNYRKCVIPKSNLTKIIQYFDEDGFEIEQKEYDRNNVFIESEKFDKPAVEKIYYDSIMVYDNTNNLTKEVGYSFINNERFIVERIIEYYDKIEL